MVVVAFPTEFEAKDLVRQLEDKHHRVVQGIPCYTGKIKGVSVVIPILGMGPEKAHASTQIILQSDEIKVFILAGFAGALTSELTRGQILVARGYSRESVINYIKLLPGFDIAGLHPVTELVSSAEEKRRLGEETGCQMIDMETAYVANLVLGAGVEFIAIRAISDLVDEDLPGDVLEHGYDYAESKSTPVKLMGFLVLHPNRIKPLQEFLKPLPEVRRKLTDFLVTVINEF
ncbi:MAG: hypothetical protein AAF558_14610 [Verrucomicrobiota bacterium]